MRLVIMDDSHPQKSGEFDICGDMPDEELMFGRNSVKELLGPAWKHVDRVDFGPNGIDGANSFHLFTKRGWTISCTWKLGTYSDAGRSIDTLLGQMTSVYPNQRPGRDGVVEAFMRPLESKNCEMAAWSTDTKVWVRFTDEDEVLRYIAPSKLRSVIKTLEGTNPSEVLTIEVMIRDGNN